MQIINPVSSGSNVSVLKTGNNRFNNFMGIATIGTGQSFAANQMRAGKVLIPGPLTLRPSLNVSIATAGAFLNAALYLADATTGLPSTKAYDLGQWDLNVTGLTANANVAVAAGEYWLVHACSAALLSTAIFVATSTTTPNATSFTTAGISPSLTATQAYANPLPANNAAAWSSSTTAFYSPVLLSVV